MRPRFAHAYRIARRALADALRRRPVRVALPGALFGVLLLATVLYGVGNLGGGTTSQADVVQIASEPTAPPTPRPTLSTTPSPPPTAPPTPEPTPEPTPPPTPDPTPPPTPEPTPEPIPEPTPLSGPPCGGPPYLTWVWRFSTDGSPQQIAAKMAANRSGVIMKTQDGTDWMSKWDPSPDAVTGPDRVAALAQLFEGNGVPFHAYAVVKGADPIKEAQMAAAVIAAGARSLFIDLEPWTGYWQGTPEGALAFGAELRRLQPDATIITAIDPRPWALPGIPLKEFASFSNALAPLTYWQTFDSPGTRDGYAKSGYPPPEGEMTPEFVLDVSASVLSRYGLPLRPVGQGTSDAAHWARFLDHATANGMPEVSAWRYGVMPGDVWSLLSERTPSGQEYTVVSGDTLGRIGRMWGVDPTRIAVANRLADPNVLYVGQVLCIPLG